MDSGLYIKIMKAKKAAEQKNTERYNMVCNGNCENCKCSRKKDVNQITSKEENFKQNK